MDRLGVEQLGVAGGTAQPDGRQHHRAGQDGQHSELDQVRLLRGKLEGEQLEACEGGMELGGGCGERGERMEWGERRAMCLLR